MYSVSEQDKEIFCDIFLSHLEELNEIVRASGIPLEGNLFYFHNTENIPDIPDCKRIHKRINLFRSLQGKSNILEVGFNAGHSALLILHSNPTAKLTSVDICRHKYTKQCFEYLKDHFKERIELLEGNSKKILPSLTNLGHKYDLIHVDGGHGYESCSSDMHHSLKLINKYCGHILLDDAHSPIIKNIYLEMIGRGFLTTETLGGSWISNENILFSIRNDNNYIPAKQDLKQETSVDPSKCQSKTFLEHYDTSHSIRLGKRSEGFRKLFKELLGTKSSDFNIVETGSIRHEDNWDGDGMSTLLFDDFLKFHGGQCWSIDISPQHIGRKICSDKVTFINNDSLSFFHSLSKFSDNFKIDLLYLDSLDITPENNPISPVHHLSELASVWHFMTKNSLICVDDCLGFDFAEGGKSQCINHFLKSSGAKLIYSGYQKIWII